MVDLDELDRLHAALPELEATSWPDVYKADSDVAVVIATIRDSEEWPHLVAEGLAVASVAILNAYPALAAEVRALRAVVDAAEAYRACREGMQTQGGHNALDRRDTAARLSEALAKVPR